MKNKFFLVSFILFSIFLIRCSVFAASDSSEYDSLPTTLEEFKERGLSDEFYNDCVEKGYIIVKVHYNDSYVSRLFTFEKKLDVTDCYIGDEGLVLVGNSPQFNATFCRASCGPTGSVTHETSLCYVSKEFYEQNSGYESIITSCTFTIYTDETLSEVFFSPPVQRGTLAQVLEETKPVEILKQAIVGYLKYLIALVVSVIAFWKGWQFLSKQLRQA